MIGAITAMGCCVNYSHNFCMSYGKSKLQTVGINGLLCRDQRFVMMHASILHLVLKANYRFGTRVFQNQFDPGYSNPAGYEDQSTKHIRLNVKNISCQNNK